MLAFGIFCPDHAMLQCPDRMTVLCFPNCVIMKLCPLKNVHNHASMQARLLFIDVCRSLELNDLVQDNKIFFAAEAVSEYA